MNASFKWLKAFLALGVRKLGSPVTPIFGIHVNFLDKFLIVSLALPPPLPTTLLSSALNLFGADSSDNPVVFNRKVSGIAILLKSWMKRQ